MNQRTNMCGNRSPEGGALDLSMPMCGWWSMAFWACVVALFLGGCLERKINLPTETVTLPTGEIVTNESHIEEGPMDSVTYNRIFFQESATAPREFVDEIRAYRSPDISLSASKPRLFRTGDRIALVIESHVFLRKIGKADQRWVHTSTNPDAEASVFLRNFLPKDDPRLKFQSAGRSLSWLNVERPEVRYMFHELSLDLNILTTGCSKPDDRSFPEFLVYRASSDGLRFKFDIELTRAANQIATPDAEGLVYDFSVITHGGGLAGPDESRETLLARPGAKEMHSVTLPLDSSFWNETKYSFRIPAGKEIAEHFAIKFGFFDPLPECVSVYYRGGPGRQEEWSFVRLGEWTWTPSSGYAGGFNRGAYFRIRRTEEPKPE